MRNNFFFVVPGLASLANLVTGQIACIQVITTTVTFQPALAASAGACPVDAQNGISYYAVNNGLGCCSSTATPRSMNTQAVACCPCGAMCTGAIPKMQEWSLNAGQIVVADSSVTSTLDSQAEVPAKSTSPFHGPYTESDGSISAGAPMTSSGSQSSSKNPSTIGTSKSTKSSSSASSVSSSTSSSSGASPAALDSSVLLDMLGSVPVWNAAVLVVISVFMALA